MDPLVEAFLITNERKTLEYVLKSIESQSMSINLTIVRNMKWVDALNECVKLCKSKYFIRIDDDMFLHKYAFAFYLAKAKRLLDRKKVGVYVCRLWEEWSKKPVNGLRMYSLDVAQKISFIPSKLGKVDKVFRNSLLKIGMVEEKNPSMVGIHALNDREDQVRYRNLWRDNNSRLSHERFEKTFDNIIHNENISLDRQYFLLNRIRKINSSYNTEYVKFIQKQRSMED